MERLTESNLLADSHVDPRASGWITDNLLHPFLNGTGVVQVYNNFAKEKVEPAYVPQAKTLSTDWAIHSLASASGAVLTYALAGKATGMGLNFVGSKLGVEGAAAKILTSQATAGIAGAGLYDFIKAPNQGETRLGNAAGTVAAFGAFSLGNSLLAKSSTIAESTLLTGLGRVGVGAVGGLTGLEASHAVSRALGQDAKVTWDDRISAMANGGFINVALPPLQKALSEVTQRTVEQIQNPKSAALETAEIKLGREMLARRDALMSPDATDKLVPNARPGAAAGDATAKDIELILLKQQFDPVLRQAQMERVATQLADFIGGAKKSLHAAVYDFRLEDPKVEKIVVDALNNSAAKGVDVKLAFFQPPEKPAGNGAVASSNAIEPGEIPAQGPTPELLAKLHPAIKTSMIEQGAHIPDPFRDAMTSAENGGMKARVIDVQKGNTGELETGVGTKGITGGGHLMHNKYFVRDSGTKDGAIWTGSTNITDGAFGDQDNNIIKIKSQTLAAAYDKDFNQLWTKGDLAGTGKDLNTTAKVGDSTVTVAFSPGDGQFIDTQIAKAIENAKTNVHIASMVISSPEVLKALVDAKAAGVPITGIYDGPQQRNVAAAWGRSKSDASAEKLAMWNQIKGDLVAKNSTPYSPDGIHDFMHNKTVSVDDNVAVTGSHNFSQNATKNAENAVRVEGGSVPGQYKTYISDLVKTYARGKR